MNTWDEPHSARDKGRTTKQMQEAPQGALFIWPFARSIGYAKDLARHLGRTDIKIVGPSALDYDGERLLGHRYPAIILDHAGRPDQREREALQRATTSCVR